MKQIQASIIHQLYKSEEGDVVDDNYVRLASGWTVFSRTNDREYLELSPIYKLLFKDLSDGKYYYTSRAAPRYPTDANDSSRTARYYEPFYNIKDPFEIYDCERSMIQVSATTWEEGLAP